MGVFFIMEEKENMKEKAGMKDLRCVPALVGLSFMAIVRGVYGMLVTFVQGMRLVCVGGSIILMGTPLRVQHVAIY